MPEEVAHGVERNTPHDELTSKVMAEVVPTKVGQLRTVYDSGPGCFYGNKGGK